MRRTIARISHFGLKTFISKKVYEISPTLHRLSFGRSLSGYDHTAYGVEMAQNWDDATFRMCIFGGHGRVLADLLEGLKKPFIFLDVGANQGLFALLAARNSACVQCLAFEPVESTFTLLERNVLHSPLPKRVQPVRAAVASKAGTAEIKLSQGHSGAASLADRDIGQGGTQTIRTVAAAEIEMMLAKDADIFVKIDVEGFEPVVIAELLRLRSAQRITHVFCEIDLDWVSFDDVSNSLSRLGLTNQSRHGGTRHFDLLAQRP